MGAFRTSCVSLEWSLPSNKPVFEGLSPHQKFPFPAQGGDRFGDCVVGPQFEPNYLHHPVFANRRISGRRQIGRFRRDFRLLNSRISVSAAAQPFSRRFWAACLRIPKFRSRRPCLSAKLDRTESLTSISMVLQLGAASLKQRRTAAKPTLQRTVLTTSVPLANALRANSSTLCTHRNRHEPPTWASHD